MGPILCVCICVTIYTMLTLTQTQTLRVNKAFRVELYWSEGESENDIAWNGYIDFPVVYLHWMAEKIKEIFAFDFAFAPI